MRVGSATTFLALLAAVAAPTRGQTRILDEGTFLVSKGGAPPHVESFKISRTDAFITATGQLVAGSEQTTSSLTTDTLGTPVRYELHVKDRGARVIDVKAAAMGGRLTSRSTTRSGDDSMRDYPVAPGRCLILESGLLHQLYFVPLAKRAGNVQLIEPRASRVGPTTVVAKGLDRVDVAGESVTATHYSMANGGAQYEFWVDSFGRLLRVEIPSLGIAATREELPR